MAKPQSDTPLVRNAPNKKERKEQKERTNVENQKKENTQKQKGGKNTHSNPNPKPSF